MVELNNSPQRSVGLYAVQTCRLVVVQAVWVNVIFVRLVNYRMWYSLISSFARGRVSHISVFSDFFSLNLIGKIPPLPPCCVVRVLQRTPPLILSQNPLARTLFV